MRFLLLAFTFFTSIIYATSNDDILLFTVATEATDGFIRFKESASRAGLEPIVLGMGEEWKGGDVVNGIGGGFKVHLLKQALEPYKYSSNVVLFTDSYDVVLLGTSADILSKFKQFSVDVMFSAEVVCWPDAELSKEYPLSSGQYKFLNSGGFIGKASVVWELLAESTELQSDEDDQLFYTKIYLRYQSNSNTHISVELDRNAVIFQNINYAINDLTIKESRILNTITNSSPNVIHANGLSKNYLDFYASNYISPYGHLQSSETDKDSTPTVLLAVFIEEYTPFLEEAFRNILSLQYDFTKIHIFLHNAMDRYEELVQLFLSELKKKGSNVLEVVDSTLDEAFARNHALKLALSYDYLFVVDSFVHLTNTEIIQHLIHSKRPLVAPLLLRKDGWWGNFWGDLSPTGYYATSKDYFNISAREILGIWNVPLVSSCYLIENSRVQKLLGSYFSSELDSDMAFAEFQRKHSMFMFVSNIEEFGFLVDPTNYKQEVLHPELYAVDTNFQLWKERYISSEYQSQTLPSWKPPEPCPDVYTIALMSPRFCNELIETMENFGQWSSGGHHSAPDHRRDNYVENVPTVDIHMYQVGLHDMWMLTVEKFVFPLFDKLFPLFSPKAKAEFVFVVKYSLGGQTSLKPHHDASTYTLNLALNRQGIDFNGGGSRFLRYNCQSTDTAQGHTLLHPGRLTHLHEGLPLINGTRYILVSFMEP